jgi:Holliday junction resolvase
MHHRTLSGAARRRKGIAAEREVARLLGVRRRYGQEAIGGPDLILHRNGQEITVEVKRRQTRPPLSEIERWMQHAAILALRVDRRPWEFCFRLSTFIPHAPAILCTTTLDGLRALLAERESA